MDLDGQASWSSWPASRNINIPDTLCKGLENKNLTDVSLDDVPIAMNQVVQAA